MTIIFVSGCVSQEIEITTTSISEEFHKENVSDEMERELPDVGEVSLDIETVNCDRNEIFIRNKGNELPYNQIEIYLDGKQENPSDITWIEHWIFNETKNKQKLFPSGKIVSSEMKTNVTGKTIEIYYRGHRDIYKCD